MRVVYGRAYRPRSPGGDQVLRETPAAPYDSDNDEPIDALAPPKARP